MTVFYVSRAVFLQPSPSGLTRDRDVRLTGTLCDETDVVSTLGYDSVIGSSVCRSYSVPFVMCSVDADFLGGDSLGRQTHRRFLF